MACWPPLDRAFPPPAFLRGGWEMASGGRTKGSPVSALLLRRHNLAKAHDRWRVPWMNKLSLWEFQNKSPPPRPQLDGSTARPGLSTHCPLMSGRAQRLMREHVPGGPSQPGRPTCVHSTTTPVTGHSGLSWPWGRSRQPVPSQLLLSLWVLGTGHRAVERRGRSDGEGERQDSTGFMPSVQTLCSASVWRRAFTRESRHPPENGDKGCDKPCRRA